jgi:hypothetical protein
MNGREKLRERSPVGEAATREDGRVRWGARLCFGGSKIKGMGGVKPDGPVN